MIIRYGSWRTAMAGLLILGLVSPLHLGTAPRPKIYYDVPFVQQKTADSCWAAALVMVLLCYGEKTSLAEVSKISGKPLDKPLAAEEQEKVFALFGFSTLPTASYTPEGWYDLLREKGPLVVTQATRPKPGAVFWTNHAVVLVGMSGRSGEPDMYVNDPGEKEPFSWSCSDFELLFEASAVGRTAQHAYIWYYKGFGS